ncbi:MAG: hypothetical protein ABI221_00780, partial [Candidatus Saccharimonadales bacterium]
MKPLQPRQAAAKRPTKPSSSAAFSYYASGRSAESKKHTIHPTGWLQKTWVRNLPSIVALSVLLVIVLYCLGLSTNQPKVILSGSGAGLRPVAVYQAGAQQILNQSLLSRTKFTINTAGFQQDFQDRFPEVSQVSLGLPLIGRRPVVSIVAAQPEIILTSNNQAYVIDKRGKAIMTAADLSLPARQKLPVINDQSGLQVKVGQTVLSSQNIRFVMIVLEQLGAKQLSTSTITLPAIPHQLNIGISGQPYIIKFDFDSDA